MAHGNILGGVAQGLESFLTNTSLAGIQQRDIDRDKQKRSDFLSLENDRKKALFVDAREINTRLNANDPEGALNVARERLDILSTIPGSDSSDTQEIAGHIQAGRFDEARNLLDLTDQIGVQQGFLSDPLDRKLKEAKLATARAKAELVKEGSLESQSFNNLIKDFTPKQQKSAKLVKVGLRGRAVSSAILSAIEDGKVQSLADARALIAQSEEFGKKTGASRSKTIDQGFERILKINVGLNNIDRAVKVLQDGAGVGAIERFLPSFKAASVELDNIRKSMALDVIGAVTFGALSQGELNLAMEVALPTGLDTPELIKYLQDRKSAQEKLRKYFNDQIQFLDQGGTVASFLRQQERNTQANTPQAGGQQQPAAQPVTIGRFQVEVQQ